MSNLVNTNEQENKEQEAEKSQTPGPAPTPPSPPSTPRSVARSAGVVSIAVMGSRILGLVREQVFSSFFGASLANAAFLIAFRVPNLLRDLFAEGALSAAFVATFSQTLAKEGDREAWRLANLVSNGLIIVLAVIAGLGILLSPEIVGFLIRDSHRIEPARAQLMTDLAVRMTRILFPFLLMVSLAAVAMGVLNTKGRFAVPASASTMFNIGSIFGGLACAYLLAPEYIKNTAISLFNHHRPAPDDVGAAKAIIGMAVGTLIGGMLQWLVQVPSLRAVGYRWQPIVSFRDPGVRQIMRMMAPAIIGAAAPQVIFVISTVFATSIAEGAAVVWLNNAWRLIQLPIGIFGVAISTATLPITSRAAAMENLDEFRRTLANSLRLTLALTIPSAAGLIILSRPIIALLYQYGRFSSKDTTQTAAALAYYSIGLAAYSIVRVLAPSFYAIRDTRIPMMASLFSIVINYAVSKITVDYLKIGHIGLALSMSAVSIVNFAILFFFMRRKLGRIEGGAILSTFAKVMLASTVMGAVCWLVSSQIENALGLDRLFARLINVGVSVAVGIAVFCLGARLLKVDELTQLTGALARRLGARFRRS